MRAKLITLVVFLSSFLWLNAQDYIFEENWKRCDPKQAAYYRLITYSAPNKPKGVVKDYYISGELQSEQYPIYIDYDDEGKTFLEGKQIYYHKNGKVEVERYFFNNQPIGPQIEYYQDGSIAAESMRNMGEPEGVAVADLCLTWTVMW